MATITKGDIVNQMYELMRISGLTVNASPEDTTLALKILERMILSYENKGLFLSYNKSEYYPDPDPNEESGLSDKSVQAAVLLLMKNTVSAFGKIMPDELRDEADRAYDGLFETIPPIRRQNPRQPSGQGTWPYCNGGESFYYSYMPSDDRLSVNDDGQLEDLTLDGNAPSGAFNQ